MNDLVVYGSPVSPFVRKVEVVLRSQGVDYDFENINIMDMPDWFKEISPARRIPVLRDRNVGTEGVPGTIADSSAICAYLERKLGAGLYGDTAFDAGRVTWLEEYADSEMAQPVGMQLFRPILFPRMAGKESDLDTARKTWNERLPSRPPVRRTASTELTGRKRPGQVKTPLTVLVGFLPGLAGSHVVVHGQHDHAVAEGQAGMRDAAFPVRHHEAGLEAERGAQPAPRRRRVAVAERRDDGSPCLSGHRSILIGGEAS